MQVTVISPEASMFDGVADAVIAPAFDGEVGILPNHAPFMTLLGSGRLTVRRGGTVVQLGNLPGGAIEAPVNLVMSKEIDLRGSFRFDREFAEAVGLIVAGEVDVRSIVTGEMPLSAAPDAFRLALDRSRSLKVMLTAG